MKQILASVVPEAARQSWKTWQRRRALSPFARAILAEDRKRPRRPDMGAREAIRLGTAWLERAQDCSRSTDGGVARDFSLISGWASSYPETTGYIVPTLLEAATFLGRPELKERVRRMLDWLVSIQLPDGGFQGGRIDQVSARSVTFNTGQILIGLAAGVCSFEDPRYRDAMRRAAQFLRDSQDADGAWRSHPSRFTARGEKAYETHVAWGLLEAARLMPGEGYGEAGLRQVRWAIGRQRPNGWFADNCLTDPAAPLTHTIGYVLRGLLEAYRFSHDTEFLNAALRTADGLVPCLDAEGSLPARLDSNWRPAASYACLTGIVQITACWFLLAELAGRTDFLAPARRANSFVRSTVRREGPPDIVGAVKGSHPIDGAYGQFEYLNWAAKFFIDANMLELAADP